MFLSVFIESTSVRCKLIHIAKVKMYHLTSLCSLVTHRVRKRSKEKRSKRSSHERERIKVELIYHSRITRFFRSKIKEIMEVNVRWCSIFLPDTMSGRSKFLTDIGPLLPDNVRCRAFISWPVTHCPVTRIFFN